MLLTLMLLACSREADDAPGRAEPTAPSTAETGSPPDTVPDTGVEGVGTGHTGATIPGPSAALQFIGEAPKNVLMISIDTFRRDHLDTHGTLGLTPFLGSLAEQGVVAANHEQCSNWTWHSTSCTLNGRYAVDTGHFPTLIGLKTPQPEQRSLATILHTDHGYGTVLASPNPWLGPRWNNAQGYAVVERLPGPQAVDLLREATRAIPQALLASRGPNWLAHAHLLEPHAPYTPPVEYVEGVDDLPPLPEGVDLATQPGHYDAIDDFEGMNEADLAVVLDHMRLLYQAEIRWLDAQVATAWQELEDGGLLEDTLVVFWTDHGEAFMEHGQQTHAHDLYGPENGAVLFFWADNIVPAHWTEPTHAVDLVPTILHALGLPIDADMPGAPLGLAEPDRVRFTSTHGRQGLQVAALKEEFKLLYRGNGETYLLFDTVADPDEAVNLLLAEPGHAVAAELRPLIDERVARIRPLLTPRLLP